MTALKKSNWGTHDKWIAPEVSGKYGAPMGRGNDDLDVTQKHYLRKVPMSPCGAYDMGGAYWGCSDYRAGIFPLYVAYTTPSENTEYKAAYVRAASRESAKKAFREEFPELKFYV